ncbi:MAG TPA: hypothetical protein IAA44_05400 [Candidatus Blautia avistercoris]|nr:hypothetical protein [Candidatus Blautia avistercoris]
MISENRDLKEILNLCVKAEDKIWAGLSLDSDFMSKHMEQKDRDKVIEGSIGCGTDWAVRIREKYPVQTAVNIIKHMGILYHLESYDKPGKNQMIFFAQYKDGQIYISRERTEEIREMVKQYQLKEILGEFEPEEVLAAHELFHYMESQNPDILTRNFKIKGCGLFRKEGCPYMASEIGAFAFARELCGISFHPRILEIIALYKPLPDTAYKIAKDIYQYNL